MSSVIIRCCFHHFYCFIFLSSGSLGVEVCYPARLVDPSLEEDHTKVSQGIGKHLTDALNKCCSSQLQHPVNHLSWLSSQCFQVWKRRKGQGEGCGRYMGAAWWGGKEEEMGNNCTPVRKHKFSLLSGDRGGSTVQGAGSKGESENKMYSPLPPTKDVTEGLAKAADALQPTTIKSRILAQASCKAPRTCPALDTAHRSLHSLSKERVNNSSKVCQESSLTL